MHQNHEVNSELEYVGISADTTEADLKQSKTQGWGRLIFQLCSFQAMQFPGVERFSPAAVWPSRILRPSELRYKANCWFWRPGWRQSGDITPFHGLLLQLLRCFSSGLPYLFTEDGLEKAERNVLPTLNNLCLWLEIVTSVREQRLQFHTSRLPSS